MPPREALNIRGQTVQSGYDLLRGLSESSRNLGQAMNQKAVLDRLKALDRQRMLVETVGLQKKYEELEEKKKAENLKGVGIQLGLSGKPVPPELQTDTRVMEGYIAGQDQRNQMAAIAEREGRIQRVGPIVEKAMKGEELTGAEYAMAREDVEPVLRRNREELEKKDKAAIEDAERKIMAKYYTGGLEALTPDERATVQARINKDEALTLRKQVEEGVSERAKQSAQLAKMREERAQDQLDLAMKQADLKVRNDYFDRALRMIQESKDEFQTRRGTFDRAAWAAGEPRLAQIEATIKKMLPIEAPVPGATPPGTTPPKDNIDAILDSMTPEELKALLEGK